MKAYKAIFFDLYGTLVDIHTDESAPALWRDTAACYAARGAAWRPDAFRARYLALCEAETARLQARTPGAEVEIDLLAVFDALWLEGGVRPDPALTAAAAWYFRQRSTTRLRVYAGAEALLRSLREAGRSVVLLSNAQACFTRPELELLSLTDRFGQIFISSEIGFRKPDVRFYRAALDALGLDAADCLMVGNDPLCDVEGAHAAGMDAVFLRSALSPKGCAAPEDAVLTLPRMDLRRLRRLLLA